MAGTEKVQLNVKEHISPYSNEELDYFRELILEKREKAKKELETLRETLDSEMNKSTNKVTQSSHMADKGSEVQEREKTYMLYNRTRKFIQYLDKALERIDNKTYGICKMTGKKISKGRLEAVPHTQLSIKAKRQR